MTVVFVQDVDGHVQNNIQKATNAMKCHDVQNVLCDDYEDELGEAVLECWGRWVVACHHTPFCKVDRLEHVE